MTRKAAELTPEDFDYLVAAAMDALPSWPALECYQQGKLDAVGTMVLEGQLRHNPAARQRYERFLEHERLMGRNAVSRYVLPKK